MFTATPLTMKSMPTRQISFGQTTMSFFSTSMLARRNCHLGLMCRSAQLLNKQQSTTRSGVMVFGQTSRTFMTQNAYYQAPFAKAMILSDKNTSLTQTPSASFSLKMRKVRAKGAIKKGIKKFKLKTKKSAQKRFSVVGSLRDRAFKYSAVGHRHLNRNKSGRNLKAAKRRHLLDHLADHKKMKRLLPYFKRRKALRC